MAIVKMSKINIIGHAESRDKVLARLHQEGTVEICDIGLSGLQQNHLIDLRLAEIDFAIRFLRKYDHRKKEIDLKNILLGKKEVSHKEMKLIAEKFEYQNVIERCKECEERQNHLRNKMHDLENKNNAITPFQSVDFYPAELKSRKFAVIFLKLKKTDLEKFENNVFRKTISRHKTSEANQFFYYWLMIETHKETEIKKNIFDGGAEILTFDYLENSFLKQYKINIEEIKRLINEIEKNDETINKEVFNIDKLEVTYDYYLMEKQKNENAGKLYASQKTFVLSGWIPEKEIKALSSKLANISPEISIIKVDPEEGEEPPVCLENRKAIGVFEVVTNVYGMPRYGELDPTPYLAGFFIVFFSICLTDAGYGIILTIMTFLALKFLNLSPDTKKLLNLIFFGGILTIIAGALTGGWFGIDPGKLPNFLSKPLNAITIFNPVKNPMLFMIIAFSLGIIQILFGIGVGMYYKIKQKQVMSAFLDNGLWISFILFIIFYVFGLIADILIIKSISLYLIAINIVLLVFTQARSEKNIIIRFLKGVLSLYGLVGYFSEMLSYSRLVALGMATGIIATVINLIANIFREMVPIPVVDIILMILILVGGHLFNIGINVLGAFIHSARLQFVEFFPKFMEGGGSKFNPFSEQGKYTIIRSN